MLVRLLRQQFDASVVVNNLTTVIEYGRYQSLDRRVLQSLIGTMKRVEDRIADTRYNRPAIATAAGAAASSTAVDEAVAWHDICTLIPPTLLFQHVHVPLSIARLRYVGSIIIVCWCTGWREWSTRVADRVNTSTCMAI